MLIIYIYIYIVFNIYSASVLRNENSNNFALLNYLDIPITDVYTVLYASQLDGISILFIFSYKTHVEIARRTDVLYIRGKK